MKPHLPLILMALALVAAVFYMSRDISEVKKHQADIQTKLTALTAAPQQQQQRVYYAMNDNGYGENDEDDDNDEDGDGAQYYMPQNMQQYRQVREIMDDEDQDAGEDADAEADAEADADAEAAEN